MENVKKQNYLIIMLIAIGIIVMFSFILQLSGGFRSVLVSNSISQGITVNGEGFIIVKPDIARVTLGMEAVAAIDHPSKPGPIMCKMSPSRWNLRGNGGIKPSPRR
jgi:hypothetical protein